MVFGPYQHTNGQQVRWTDKAGKQKVGTFATVKEADEFKAKCQAIIDDYRDDREFGIDFREPDGTLTWWVELIGTLAHTMVTTDDLTRAKHLGSLLSHTGNASKTMKTFIDNSAIEKRLEALEQHDKTIAAQKRSARVSGTRGEVLPFRDSSESSK